MSTGNLIKTYVQGMPPSTVMVFVLILALCALVAIFCAVVLAPEAVCAARWTLDWCRKSLGPVRPAKVIDLAERRKARAS